MANVKAKLSNLKIGDPFEATVHFMEEDGLATDVTVNITPTDDAPLSKIAEQAIAKAREFLRRVTQA
jgi:VCBS repeat-containing protein